MISRNGGSSCCVVGIVVVVHAGIAALEVEVVVAAIAWSAVDVGLG